MTLEKTNELTIAVLGIGPSGSAFLTEQVKMTIHTAVRVFGSSRQLSAAGVADSVAEPYDSLNDLIARLSQWLSTGTMGTIAVLASGDPSFYGVAKTICNQFGSERVVVLPGISAVQYLFSKIKWDMNDLYMTSAHGRVLQMDRLLSLPKIAVLTDRQCGPFEIAQLFLAHGEDPTLVIGESLGYPEEQISEKKASMVESRHYEMNVVLIDRAGSRNLPQDLEGGRP